MSNEIRLIAQLTGEITTQRRHEIKSHITVQFKLLEVNVIIETDKIVFGWIMILIGWSTVGLITTKCLNGI
jgi:hypothetical protein